ncbi:MAG: 2-polyprenyl-6-methoxyphenol 4-hydroxylase [Pseudohongiellaceae bacterium]|jgi:2-polyprenyl-6-methoxyphenol 4-hydroxylase
MQKNVGSECGKTLDYDVIIAGGGMVGASLALALNYYSQQKIKVLVVESYAPSDEQSNLRYSPSFDGHSTALSYGSQIIYQQLGLWPLLSQQVTPIENIHVSSRGAFSSSKMTAEEMNWPALGYVIENAWLGKVLLNALQQTSITMACPASVLSAQFDRVQVSVLLEENGQQRNVTAQLLVVADGANSQLRAQLGIEHSTHNYQQSAIVANVCFDKPHQRIAFERFTDEGPMALLPLSADNNQLEKNKAALVWTQTPAQAESLCRCEEQVFLSCLQQRFGHRLGKFTKVGERIAYPLQLLTSDEQVRSNVVVMGNAAHALHPVAGQGFNLALRDCARLTELLIRAINNQQSLGDISLLTQYQQAQNFDQQKTILFSDKIGELFANPFTPLSVLRNLGLISLDVFPPLRQTFVRHAAGQHNGAALGYIAENDQASRGSAVGENIDA